MADQQHKPGTGTPAIRHYLGLIRALSESAESIVKEYGERATYDDTRVEVRAALAQHLPDLEISEAWVLYQSIAAWIDVFQGSEDPPLGRVNSALGEFIGDACPHRPRDVLARSRYLAHLGDTGQGLTEQETQGLTFHADSIAEIVYGTWRRSGHCDNFGEWAARLQRMAADEGAQS